jgi:hypothetical protein
MAEQESALARNANKHFRKEAQGQEGALNWKEHTDQEAATRLKTAKLRALARDVSLAGAPVISSKRAVKVSLRKSIPPTR